MTKQTSPKPYAILAISVCIFLLYAVTRSLSLLAFPPFLDEIDHILWARDVYSLHPFTGAANGKLFGLWWMAAFDLSGDSSVFMVRAATALFQMLTVAGLIRLGRQFAAYGAGFAAALIYILSPYAFFYDRLALMDAYVVAFAVLLTVFTVRSVTMLRPRAALLTGGLLCGAILAKATGVMLFVIPLLGFILRSNLTVRQRIRQLALTYGAFVILWFPFYALLQWRGYHYFNTAQTVVGTSETTNILARFWANVVGTGGIIAIDSHYHSWAFLLLTMMVALIYVLLHWRSGLFLLGALTLPLAGLLLFATKLSPRYFQFHIPFAYVLLALGLWSIGKRWRGAHWALLGGVIIVWGGLVTFPFYRQYFTDPAQLDIPQLDRLEYIESDAAGFAIAEVAAYLQHVQPTPVQIAGWLANCNALALALPDTQPIDCLTLSTDPATQAGIVDDLNRMALLTDHWLVYEESAFTNRDNLSDHFAVAAIFERPNDRTRLILYQSR